MNLAYSYTLTRVWIIVHVCGHHNKVNMALHAKKATLLLAQATTV